MHKTILKTVFTSLMLLIGMSNVKAKVADNSTFEKNEILSYNLYYKYGLINAKAGISTLETSLTKFKNQKAYKIVLTAQSAGLVGKFYKLNDTLTCYTDQDMKPLLFTKFANEGNDTIYEKMTYKYFQDSALINSKRTINRNLKFNLYLKVKNPTYDLVSVVLFARNIDYSQKNKKIDINFVTGHKEYSMTISYVGDRSIDANDGKSYNCMKLILSLPHGDKDAFENCDEAMVIYITKDEKRIPIELKSKLKVGYTEAFLSGIQMRN